MADLHDRQCNTDVTIGPRRWRGLHRLFKSEFERRLYCRPFAYSCFKKNFLQIHFPANTTAPAAAGLGPMPGISGELRKTCKSHPPVFFLDSKLQCESRSPLIACFRSCSTSLSTLLIILEVFASNRRDRMPVLKSLQFTTLPQPGTNPTLDRRNRIIERL